MKSFFIIPGFLLICSLSNAQTGTNVVCDTIYMGTQKVACNVKEVSPEAVWYYYPGETVVNSVYINAIQKIVFKSGRVQTFAAATSYKTVNNCDDYDNVTFTTIASEVHGIYKLGDVSAKARGTTKFADENKVKERAMRKLKIRAAMMGGNIVLLNQNQTTSNGFGGIYSGATSSIMEGVAYTSKLPDIKDFNELVGNKTSFQTIEEIRLQSGGEDMEYIPFVKHVIIQKISNENGLIMIDALIDGLEGGGTNYRVVNFSKDEFTLLFMDDSDIYNIRVKL